MSFKIWFLALMLMAISGIVSGADSASQGSFSFDTTSFGDIPVIEIPVIDIPVICEPSCNNPIPQIQIIGSYSNTATSWNIGIFTSFNSDFWSDW